MTFGDGRGIFTAIGSVGQAGADELVKTSIDGGINFFDTADNYAEGESERILGQSLKNLDIARKDVVIATKVYSRVGRGSNDIGASRGHIMDGVEDSLRRLQTDHIDLYQIHGNDPVTPIAETLRALDTLVQQGKVRYIGCSNWQAWKIAKALGISEFKNLARFDTLQAYYSIAGRDLEREIVPLLESKKPACSCGVRWPAACFPASSAGRTKSPRNRAASATTFPLWTKSGPGRSLKRWLRSLKHMGVVPRVSRSHGSWQSLW
jgi:aryl-alcohol dehydrogenase-like predicted oxidoreductase